MNPNPIMMGLCYYSLMFLLTLIFYKPLCGWLKNFKQNLHSIRLDESVHSELENEQLDEENDNLQNQANINLR